MEQYKSNFIKREDIEVFTNKTEYKGVKKWIVTVYHFSSGITTASANRGQLIAYNEALKELEEKINDIIIKEF